MPIGKMTCGADQPTKNAHCLARKVSFIFYCAPRDDNHLNPMYAAVHGTNAELIAVTDSASYLDRLPYVVIDADTKKVIFPYENSKSQVMLFNTKTSSNTLQDGKRNMHILPPINIPNEVKRIALHIANDALLKHRDFQLFPWIIPDATHSKVYIYETRTDLQEEFTKRNNLGSIPKENTLAAKPGTTDEYFGYLNGDLWLNISHKFADKEIAQLCPKESLSRPALKTSNHSAPAGRDTLQTVEIDWAVLLQSIYRVGENSRSLDAFSVQISTLGITLHFPARAFANAINTSARTTVQQALQRTSPRAFAVILKAAWRLNIDTIYLSSSWRPMLGSRLHKMGVSLDVTQFGDTAENINFSIHNHGKVDQKQPFPTTVAGAKMSQLYDELNSDQNVKAGEVYTPWINWIEPHDTHMHITVKND